VSDGVLLDAMAAHPKLVERPIVETPLGVRLCRPAERVDEVLHPPR
jgi:arsenate reductase